MRGGKKCAKAGGKVQRMRRLERLVRRVQQPGRRVRMMVRRGAKAVKSFSLFAPTFTPLCIKESPGKTFIT